MNAERLKWNLLHGIYGSRAEFRYYASQHLNAEQLAELYADDEVREELADMPEVEIIDHEEIE